MSSLVSTLSMKVLVLSLAGCGHIFPGHQQATIGDEVFDRGRIIVEIAGSEHWALERGEHQRAALADTCTTDEQWVVINAEYNQDRFDNILKHELAHFIAWERYGPHIEEHGPEFRKVCRELIKDNPDFYCRRGFK